MNFPSLPRLTVLLAALPVAAWAADWQALLGNSPFGAPAPVTATATGDLEFRGVVQEEGVYFVNLYNPATKTSQWMPVNGQAPGLEVKSYDASADRVQITQAGRALTLPLKQARIALVAMAPVAAPAPAGGLGAAPGGENVNPDNPEDRRAQIREMIRARLQNGQNAPNGPNGEPVPLMRNLPPEAQAMIEEYRRRRAEGAANSEPGQRGRPVHPQN